MPTINMFYDKNGVLRSGWTGKEIKCCNVPVPPPKKAQQCIKVDLRTTTNIETKQKL